MSNHISVPPSDNRDIFYSYLEALLVKRVNCVAFERTDGFFFQYSSCQVYSVTL